METTQSYDQLISRIEELEAQVTESHEIIDAIRKGEVDAFVVKNEDTHELYTLKSADKSYRVFIEQMNEGALTINEQNTIIYSNSRFAKQLNLPLEKVIGFDLLQLMPPAFMDTVSTLLARARETGESKDEIVIPGPEGKTLPLLLSLNSINLEGSNAISIIVTDLSLQKESQQQKKVMDKKDEFISIASHELKTPVTSIKGYVQLLRHNFEQEGHTEAADMLGKVDTQINKLTSLIGDLLDVKKMENGQLQYNQDSFDFNELVMETIEETQRVIGSHIIKYTLEESATITGDRNKIGQVITNLIDNAAKYSPGDSDIIIKTSLDKKNIRLSVRDFGIGIPIEQQEKVFDRFFRVNRENDITYAGLGLGLYISAEIIKRHMGTLSVESAPGKGALFYFDLPVPNN